MTARLWTAALLAAYAFGSPRSSDRMNAGASSGLDQIVNERCVLDRAIPDVVTDVQFFRNMRNDLGLEEAWVTNGLNTLHVRAAEFDKLTAR